VGSRLLVHAIAMGAACPPCQACGGESSNGDGGTTARGPPESIAKGIDGPARAGDPEPGSKASLPDGCSIEAEQISDGVFRALSGAFSSSAWEGLQEELAAHALSKDRVAIILRHTEGLSLTCTQLDELVRLVSLEKHKEQLIFQRYTHLSNRSDFVVTVVHRYTRSETIRKRLIHKLNEYVLELKPQQTPVAQASDASPNGASSQSQPPQPEQPEEPKTAAPEGGCSTKVPGVAAPRDPREQEKEVCQKAPADEEPLNALLLPEEDPRSEEAEAAQLEGNTSYLVD